LINPELTKMEYFNLSITANLHDELLHLRDRLFGRIMWVVAICINQKDDCEKKGVIQIMADIYPQARCVVVWLQELGVASVRPHYM
jgi:Heterokaryon incompatibility protein (HET)